LHSELKWKKEMHIGLLKKTNVPKSLSMEIKQHGSWWAIEEESWN